MTAKMTMKQLPDYETIEGQYHNERGAPLDKRIGRKNRADFDELRFIEICEDLISRARSEEAAIIRRSGRALETPVVMISRMPGGRERDFAMTFEDLDRAKARALACGSDSFGVVSANDVCIINSYFATKRSELYAKMKQRCDHPDRHRLESLRTAISRLEGAMLETELSMLEGEPTSIEDGIAQVQYMASLLHQRRRDLELELYKELLAERSRRLNDLLLQRLNAPDRKYDLASFGRAVEPTCKTCPFSSGNSGPSFKSRSFGSNHCIACIANAEDFLATRSVA